jgi:cytochrome c biogenesis protein CcmG/thiol:disulfide interchange protein DsbE
MRVILFVAMGFGTTTAHAAATFNLDQLKGHVVYLDFWASWCEPCRKSFPWLRGMNNTYGRAGLTVIAVDVDSERADAERFLLQFNPNFDIQFDPLGKLAETFKVTGMPTSVIIDKHGNERFRHIGFLPADAATYEGQVRTLLGEP